MPDLLAELSRLDPATGPLPVQPDSLTELRDAVLATPRRRMPRWAAPLAAAAALVVAIALVWQSALGRPDLVAVPAATPTATLPAANTWVETSRSPLAPRHNSIAVWVNQAFYIIGGDTSPVCPANADCLDATHARDGARYDPVTNSWTPIAAAPEDVTAHRSGITQHGVIIGHTLYVLGETSLLSYDLDADAWQTHPAQGSDLIGFGTDSSSLIAVSLDGERVTYSTFRPDQAGWARKTVDVPLHGTPASAAIVVGLLVLVGGVSESDAGSWTFDVLDPATGTLTYWSMVPVERQPSEPVVLTTDGATQAAWGAGQTHATYLDPRGESWTTVPLPTIEGTFVGGVQVVHSTLPLAVSGMVSLRGHLFDLSTKLWAPTPALPTGYDDPVLATSDDLVFACFGQDHIQRTLATRCFVMRPVATTYVRP